MGPGGGGCLLKLSGLLNSKKAAALTNAEWAYYQKRNKNNSQVCDEI